MDSAQGSLNPVDQGTVFMLSLSFGLLAVALVYFVCIWYRKRKSKDDQIIPVTATITATTTKTTTTTGRETKPHVNRTFSRFSQVDEECTFYGDDQDLEMLKSYVEANQNKHSKGASSNSANQIKRSRSAAADSSTRIIKVSAQVKREHRKSAPDERQYLETSI